MSDPDVISEADFFHADDQVAVPDRDVVSDFTFPGVQDGQPDSHPLAYPVAEEQAIAGAF